MGEPSNDKWAKRDQESAQRLLDKPWGEWTKADTKKCGQLLEKKRALALSQHKRGGA